MKNRKKKKIIKKRLLIVGLISSIILKVTLPIISLCFVITNKMYNWIFPIIIPYIIKKLIEIYNDDIDKKYFK